MAVEGRGIGIGGIDWWRGVALGQEKLRGVALG